jgi:predicted GIY-YIG superfamily endonuclease
MSDNGDAPAFVYLLCFAHNPYQHARHYLGVSTQPLEQRLAAHRGDSRYGRPAVLMRALRKAGGTFILADVWDCASAEDAFALERRLKKQANGSRICSICSPGNRRGTGSVGRPRRGQD